MKIKIKRFGKKKSTPSLNLTILFLCASPVAIENITAQVQDVDISTVQYIGFSSLFGNLEKAQKLQ
jgi:hypothetical protein